MSNLHFTIIDLPETSLYKTSVLVTGDQSSVIVDAGFTRGDGHRIVAAALDSGTTPEAVLITAGDPDFYFGAEVVADAFPGVRFLAPADVISHIRDTYEDKLVAWADLGTNLPTRLVDIEEFVGTYDLEGKEIQVRSAGEELGDRQWFVFVPSAQALLGGILVFNGLHVWTADTKTAEARAHWLTGLDVLDALRPTFVVAGHRTAGGPTDHSAISFTREYLHAFNKAIDQSADAAQAEAALQNAYPDAGMELSVSLGTKVAKGEMSWG